MNNPSESLPPESTTPRPVNPRRPDEAQPTGSLSDANSAVERFQRRIAAKQGSLGGVDAEETLWQGGYSLQAMGGVWLAALLATIALVAVALIYETLPLLIALAIAASIWIVAGLVFAARRLGIQYELTTQRFIHQHGVLARRTERIEVIDIEDVSFYQGPVQRMLGIGTIEITSTDRSHPHLIMPGIAEVKTVAGLIDDIRRRERQRRSLHIRSM